MILALVMMVLWWRKRFEVAVQKVVWQGAHPRLESEAQEFSENKARVMQLLVVGMVVL